MEECGIAIRIAGPSYFRERFFDFKRWPLRIGLGKNVDWQILFVLARVFHAAGGLGLCIDSTALQANCDFKGVLLSGSEGHFIRKWSECCKVVARVKIFLVDRHVGETLRLWRSWWSAPFGRLARAGYLRHVRGFRRLRCPGSRGGSLCWPIAQASFFVEIFPRTRAALARGIACHRARLAHFTDERLGGQHKPGNRAGIQ